ncbi:unnamed protein product, partial [Medioppia subpectinata]
MSVGKGFKGSGLSGALHYSQTAGLVLLFDGPLVPKGTSTTGAHFFAVIADTGSAGDDTGAHNTTAATSSSRLFSTDTQRSANTGAELAIVDHCLQRTSGRITTGLEVVGNGQVYGAQALEPFAAEVAVRVNVDRVVVPVISVTAATLSPKPLTTVVRPKLVSIADWMSCTDVLEAMDVWSAVGVSSTITRWLWRSMSSTRTSGKCDNWSAIFAYFCGHNCHQLVPTKKFMSPQQRVEYITNRSVVAMTESVPEFTIIEKTYELDTKDTVRLLCIRGGQTFMVWVGESGVGTGAPQLADLSLAVGDHSTAVLSATSGDQLSAGLAAKLSKKYNKSRP